MFRFTASVKLVFAFLLGLFILWVWQPEGCAFASGPERSQSAEEEKTEREMYDRLRANERIAVLRQADTEEAEAGKRPTVYLTFDDGPSKLTSQVLDILKQYGIKGTFFVLGKEAEAYPDMIRRIVEEGHGIGNHTYNHVYREVYSSFSAFWDQIQKTEQILNEIAGVRPRLIRAPGGTYTNFDAFYYYYLDQAGYIVQDWNSDSGDSRRAGVPAEEIIASVKNTPLQEKMVVLLHDSSGHGETVKALPEIIHYFLEQGYEFASLTEGTKPVQFRLGASKWQRDESFAFFRERLKTVVNYRLERERMESIAEPGTDQPVKKTDRPAEIEFAEKVETAAQGAGQLPVILAHNEESPKLPFSPDSMPLIVEVNGGNSKIAFQSREYNLRDGRFYVPLRKLAEQFGGNVKWDRERRTAVVNLGFVTAEYRIDERTVRRNSPGSAEKTYHLAEMELVNGSLVVPLRTTLQLWGDSVEGYTVNKTIREVYVKSRGGRPVLLFKNLFVGKKEAPIRV